MATNKRRPRRRVGMKDAAPYDLAHSALVVGQASALLGFASGFCKEFDITTDVANVGSGSLLGKELADWREFASLAASALHTQPDAEAIWKAIQDMLDKKDAL